MRSRAASIVVFVACLQRQLTAADSPAIANQGVTASQTTNDSVARTHASHPPLYLEVRATVHGAGSRLRRPFVSDIALHQGDELELLARTSSAAHVYLLHCAGDARLSVFPDAAGIAFHADRWVPLPAAGLPLRVGATPGTETLYVVATRQPLARSDLPLLRQIQQGLSGDGAQCGDALEVALAGTPDVAGPGSQPGAAGASSRRSRYALRGVDITTVTSRVARAFAEQDGIVVIRLSYLNAPGPAERAAAPRRDAHPPR